MKYLLIFLLTGCTPPRNHAKLVEKMKCLDEATAASVATLDLIEYQDRNSFLMNEDMIASLSYAQLLNKQATEECEK